jgi:hypothetical protein
MMGQRRWGPRLRARIRSAARRGPRIRTVEGAVGTAPDPHPARDDTLTSTRAPQAPSGRTRTGPGQPTMRDAEPERWGRPPETEELGRISAARRWSRPRHALVTSSSRPRSMVIVRRTLTGDSERAGACGRVTRVRRAATRDGRDVGIRGVGSRIPPSPLFLSIPTGILRPGLPRRRSGGGRREAGGACRARGRARPGPPEALWSRRLTRRRSRARTGPRAPPGRARTGPRAEPGRRCASRGSSRAPSSPDQPDPLAAVRFTCMPRPSIRRSPTPPCSRAGPCPALRLGQTAAQGRNGPGARADGRIRGPGRWRVAEPGGPLVMPATGHDPGPHPTPQHASRPGPLPPHHPRMRGPPVRPDRSGRGCGAAYADATWRAAERKFHRAVEREALRPLARLVLPFCSLAEGRIWKPECRRLKTRRWEYDIYK